MTNLSSTMTIKEFDNGYWYADELKGFAKEIGIPGSNQLRKDELEFCIRNYLKTGEKASPRKVSKNKHKIKDVDRGLSLDLIIRDFTNDKETKSFIQQEALKICPDMPSKSGARYWLNRWREEQLEKGKEITYADLVKQFVILNTTREKFPKIPSAKFNNFITDFLESNPGETRANAMAAWEELKKLDIQKTFKAWEVYKKTT